MRRPLQRCGACGHFGHLPGKRCPLNNLVADDRKAARDAAQVRQIFGHRPDLVALLEAMRANWKPERAAA